MVVNLLFRWFINFLCYMKRQAPKQFKLLLLFDVSLAQVIIILAII